MRVVYGKKPNTIQFTKAGFEKLQTDHKRLTDEREEVLKRLQQAREMGDLSENGMYKAAKFELGSIDRQLRKINHLLVVGRIEESKNDGTISFASLVTLEMNAKKIVYTLVNEHESDPSKGKISTQSPLGSLLLGKKVGESVELITQLGKTTYKIIEVN